MFKIFRDHYSFDFALVWDKIVFATLLWLKAHGFFQKGKSDKIAKELGFYSRILTEWFLLRKISP